MMDEGGELHNIAKKQTERKRGTTVRLAEVARRVMDERISPRQAKLGSVIELWSELLPDELARHCKLVDVTAGQLKVQVDSPSYASELRWCSSQLIEELQRHCPQAGIKKVKFIIG